MLNEFVQVWQTRKTLGNLSSSTFLLEGGIVYNGIAAVTVELFKCKLKWKNREVKVTLITKGVKDMIIAVYYEAICNISLKESQASTGFEPMTFALRVCRPLLLRKIEKWLETFKIKDIALLYGVFRS